MKHIAKVLPVLIVAGCGTSPAVMQATQAKSAPAVTAKTATAAKSEAGVKIAELSTRGAYARLRSSTSFVPKGGRAWLDLDVWSDDKKIKTWEANWHATEGHLDRWYTRDWGSNGWWAPFNPFSSASWISARVRVVFEDGTDASGTLQTTIWVDR